MHQGRGTQSAWREGAVAKPTWGFRFFTALQLTMLAWALRERLIQPRDAHVYFGCHELVWRRQKLERGRKPRYRAAELVGLCGRGEESIRASLRKLHRLGLISWPPGSHDDASAIGFARSPEQLEVEDLASFWAMLEAVPNNRRKVPVPRQVLLLMAGGAARAVLVVLIAQMLCGLFYRRRDGRGECWPVGACKVPWIAATFGVGESTVLAARSHLQRIGLLVPRETHQRALNRHGRFFQLNLEWSRPDAAVVDNSTVGEGESGNESRPLPPVSGNESRPPRDNWESPSESKHQEPGSARPVGVCSKEKNLPKPTRRRLRLEDLDDTSRLFTLFEEARRDGLVHGAIDPGNRDLREFVAIAEHARTIGTRNPCGLFRWLVERWGKRFVLRGRELSIHELVTEGDEDAAHQRIKRHLNPTPFARDRAPKVSRDLFQELSEDAKFAQAAQRALRQRGLTAHPFVYVRQYRPDWTRERWDAAVAEFEAARLNQARLNAHVGESVGELVGAFMGAAL